MLKLFIFFLLLFLIFPKSVSAHAFGSLYTLPLPEWLYLYGGAAAVIISFLIIGLLVNQKSSNFNYLKKDLSPNLDSVSKNKSLLSILKFLSVFLLIFTILTGFVGLDIATLNFNMTFFWIIFFLGFSYLTALIGNLWEEINPWKTLIEWGERFLDEDQSKGVLKYSQNLGYYPALIGYFILIYIELISRNSPKTLSIYLLIYTLITLGGSILFGKDKWFKYGEFFSVFFRLIAKISPFGYQQGKIYLRLPLIDLLKEKVEHFSLLLFILFMLSSTAFDGFRETIVWGEVVFNFISPLSPIMAATIYQYIQTIALFLSPLIFLIIYLLSLALMKALVKGKLSIKDLALEFGYSLIPIALVYNIAHYYSLLITQGVYIIRLISDPFGFGWDLFKTSTFEIILIPDSNFIWHSQVFFILLGHIAAVYLAHIIALKLFPSHKKAIISQIPMLLLMVIYTMAGLWILSQPLGVGG